MSNAADKAAEELVQRYNNADTEATKMLIIEALGNTGSEVAVEKLGYIARNGDYSDKRDAALKALGNIGKSK